MTHETGDSSNKSSVSSNRDVQDPEQRHKTQTQNNEYPATLEGQRLWKHAILFRDRGHQE
jgi:hypothetical protein